jgi:hypothetical protein
MTGAGSVLPALEASMGGSSAFGVGRACTLLPADDIVDSCRVRGGTPGEILDSRCGRVVKYDGWFDSVAAQASPAL